jgi:hypothetical protein
MSTVRFGVALRHLVSIVGKKTEINDFWFKTAISGDRERKLQP